ncbi:hypothetical protein [Paraburkholderia kirstenboschensis]|uniref:hypothetical protein n=1 Tax=Paraburkholderia kirstenboschensis TaxID=1245436 RepID=UPI00374377D2
MERVRTGASHVQEAGTKMHEITREIRRVTDIMGEITAASQEQNGDRPGQPGRHADG